MARRTVVPPDVRHDKQVDAAKARAVTDGWKGFVNLELNEQQKLGVKALRERSAEVWMVIEDLVDGQYKASMSYDPNNDTYNFSMTCKKKGDINEGMTLTGRGGTLIGSMASFVYKHRDVLEGDWTSVGVQRGRGVDEDFVG